LEELNHTVDLLRQEYIDGRAVIVLP
jgi:hypothetical protein